MTGVWSVEFPPEFVKELNKRFVSSGCDKLESEDQLADYIECLIYRDWGIM